MEYDVDQKDPQNDANCSRKDAGSTPDNNTEENLQIATELATPATPATPGQNYEALYNETKNRFLEYTLNAERRFTKLKGQYDQLLIKIDNCSNETSDQEKNLAAEVAALKKENDELKIRISEDRILSKNKMRCKPGQCRDDGDDKKLLCDKCKKLFHYSCTELPLYQLTHLMTKGYRKYLCHQCTVIPEYLREGLESQQEYVESPDPEVIQKLLSNQENKEKELSGRIKELEEQLRVEKSNPNSEDKFRDEILTLESRLRTQGLLLQKERTMRKTLEDGKQQLQGDGATHQKKVADMQVLLDKKTEEAVKLEGENKSLRIKVQSGTGADMETLLNKRLEKIENSIDLIISKKLNENMRGVTEIGEKIDDAITANKKSFAQAIEGNVTDSLTTAFRNRKNQEIVNEAEREKRSANLIIYGVTEPSAEDQKEHDQSFVTSLLEKIGVAQRPKQILRLGQRDDNKTRPVKLVMENETEKDTIMARLSNLKNAEDTFRKVSIREDYTREERELVREWVKKAAEKNDAENTKEWKVRGTPKTGLRLVRIPKRQ